ncbi:MAG: DUF3343 domain-containing protein [Clostridia bacterium]|nr:DUF3343 domain-containing protein [Clostridia bacterium]MBD5561067.1 DUF3343 domain-containing protein [Clostridia bacterium]
MLGQKERRVIITFFQTADAMQMEKVCRDKGIPGRLIPVPPAISAGCGMCWSAPPAARQALEDAMQSAGISCQGICEMEI